MLALVAALEDEISGLKGKMRIIDSDIYRESRYYRASYLDRKCILVRTGVGRERARAATRFLLKNYPVEGLVSFGFGGGLTDEIRTGDIVLCSRIFNENPDAKVLSSHPDLMYAALTLEMAGSRQGKGLTVSRLAGTPGAKRALKAAIAADVADMESYWVARVAAERRVPFLSVRVIFDTAENGIEAVSGMLNPNGTLRTYAAPLYFAAHPRHLTGIPALYRSLRRARANLTRFLTAFISSYEAPGEKPK